MMTCQQATRLGLGVVLVLVGVVGCGKPGTAPTVKVSGTVTYNGEPVQGASVAFIPENGRPASGTTDASGKFTLSTFESGDGAVLGKHTVTIAETSEAPSGEGEVDYSIPDESAARFPAKYADPSTSDFTATVEKGGETDFTFDMTD
ncbi:MAG: carboxypeptidase-like regulatory domain-containing protein [Planctomycetota bacterium]